MKEPFDCQFPERHQAGIALVTVLAIIVVTSIMVVSYFTLTRQELSTSANYAQSIKSESLLESALLLLQHELNQELRSGSNATTLSGGGEVFIPTNSFSAQPVTIVNEEEAKNLPNLVRRSARNSFVTANLPPAANYPYAASLLRMQASNVSTIDSSLNGRRMTNERWNKPAMMTPAGLASFIPPDWILLTRMGPLVFSNATSATTLNGNSVPADPGNRASQNTSYVTGRFAYTIYRSDHGLDVNACGAPVLPTAVLNYTRRVRIQPFADLTRISADVTPDQWSALVRFRNKLTSSNPYNATTPSDPLTFMGWVTAPLHGFLFPAAGDQRFMSRQELLKFWNDINAPASVLPYLSTFTRERNSPSYFPNPNRPKTGANDDAWNPAFPSLVYPQAVTVPKDATLQADLNIKQGDPLVIRRFPLCRLKWLTTDGPSASSGGDSGGTAANIQRYFGLTWDTANGKKRWIYNHGNADRILTLGELQSTMAVQKREPDFFELLKAAIVYGSLGLELNNGTAQPALASTESANLDLQIIKIAANIIDQADTDGYPTVLTYSNGGGYPEVYGIEDLPYLNKFYHVFLRIPSAQTRLNAYILPEVWRPAYASSSAGIANGPDTFRICVQRDSTLQVSTQYTTSSSPTPPSNTSGLYINSPNGPVRTFNAADSDASALQFSVPTTDGDSLTQPRLLLDSNSTTSNPANRVQNVIYSNIFPSGSFNRWNLMYLNFVTIPAATRWVHHQTLRNFTLTLEMQYRDGAGGPWRTYSEWKAISSGNAYSSQNGTSPDTHVFDGRYHYFKLDPRTERMGSDTLWNSVAWTTDGKGVENRTIGHPSYKNAKSNYTSMSGFGSYNSYKWRPWYGNDGPVTWFTTNLGEWHRSTDFIINRAAPQQLNWYVDPDRVVRGGDGYYALNSSGDDISKIGVPLSDTSNFISRSFILNRPFRSVAELGSVYRDMPWRSLDFCTSQSADAALLDVFCVDETPPVRAGVVGINTRYPEVLQALISGNQGSGSIPIHELGTGGSIPSSDALSDSEIASLARNFVERTSTMPLQNKSEIVTRLMEEGGTGSLTSAYSNDNSRRVKVRRETIVRALGESVQSRTWNLLVDVVVQSGRYRKGATNLASDFLVEGEKRVWWYVAIDRYTGKIVDQQMEPVYE